MIGDFLYTLTPRDTGAPKITPFFFQQAVNTAAVSHSITLVAPLNLILLVCGVSITVQPGAAQTFTHSDATVEPIEGGVLGFGTVVLKDATSVAGGAQGGRVQTFDAGSLILDRRTNRLLMRAFYSAGAAVNNSNFGVWGLLLPPGSLQTPQFQIGA